MEFISHIHLLSAVVNLFMAGIILSRGIRSPLNRISALLFISLAIWSGGLVVVHTPTVSRQTAQLFLDISSIGGIAALPIFLHFTFVFTGISRKRPSRIITIAASVFTVFLVALQLLTQGIQIIDRMDPHAYGWSFTLRAESIWPSIFIGFSSLCILGGIGLLIRDYLTRSDRLRQKLTRMIIGCWVVLFVFSLTLNLLTGPVDALPFLVDTVFMLWAAAILFAMMRYRIHELSPRNAAEEIISTMSDALLILTRDAVIASANNSALLLLETTEPTLIDRPITDFFFEEDLSWSYENDARPIKTVETLCRTASGRVLSVLLSRTWFSGEGKLPRGMVSVFHDISGLKLTEQMLRQNEFRYRTIFENIQDIYYETLLDGTIAQLSPSVAAITKYSREELIGKQVQTLYENASRRGDLLDQLKTSGYVSDFEIDLIDKDGRSVPCSITARILLDDNGKPAKISGTMRDISERKKNETSLRKAHDEWEKTFTAMSDLIMIVDRNHRILRMNRAMKKSLGIDEPTGRLCHEIVHNLPSWPGFCPHSRLLVDGKEHSTEIFEQHLGRHFMVSVSPLHDDDGNVVGSVHVMRDISERKIMENALRTAHDELEEKVEERTRELREANAELVKANLRAEEANAAKSRFIATMSHEIRTPLNGVIGMADLLFDASLSESQRNYASIIRSSGNALLALTNSILDFSKLEAEKLTLDIAPMDLRALFAELREFLTPQAGERHISLTATVDDAVPQILSGDRGHLRQVLLNLASNAFKFTSSGSISITAGVESQDHARTTVRFSVSDTGIGIPPDKLESIFSPFVQADGGMTRKYGGTGLGLTIAKQLVELMGGNIGVESQVGKGSIFSFAVFFPRHEEDTGDPAMIWNEEEFIERAMHNSELARDIIARFLEDTPLLIDELIGGIDRDTLRQTFERAHRINGSAATVAAHALRNAAASFETLGENPDPDHLRNLGNTMKQEFDKLSTVLRASRLI